MVGSKKWIDYFVFHFRISYEIVKSLLINIIELKYRDC